MKLYEQLGSATHNTHCNNRQRGSVREHMIEIKNWMILIIFIGSFMLADWLTKTMFGQSIAHRKRYRL
jgi:hypothetical protein